MSPANACSVRSAMHGTPERGDASHEPTQVAENGRMTYYRVQAIVETPFRMLLPLAICKWCGSIFHDPPEFEELETISRVSSNKDSYVG